MFCPNCGSRTTEGDSFCAKCGARLSGGVPAAAPKKKSSKLPFILGIGVIIAAVAAAVVILVLMMSGGEPDDPQPAESAPQPAESALQPAESASQPVESALQPEESTPQPVESAPQPARGLSAEAERAYAEKVRETAAEYSDMKFALIDLTDNNDLDLAVVNTGYSVSVYTWSGGRLIPIMEEWAYGAFGNQGYEYLPGRNVIRNFNSDYAGAIVYENYLYLNSAYEPQWPSAEEQLCIYYFRDANGNGWPDDGEPYTEDEPFYYYGGVEVSREEYASHQVPGEFLWIDGDQSAEEMLALLHYDGGGAPAPGGSDGRQRLYKMAGDEYAEFLMIADGAFTMKVNLYECIGTITGTYEDAGDRMKCHIVSRDFSGFSGDNVEEFEMLYGDAALLYRGADIGTTEDGTIFRYTP